MNRTPSDRSGRTALLACAAAFFSVLLTGCGETPQSAYEQIIQHGENGQFDKVWDRIDKKSQGKLEARLGDLAKLGAGLAALAGKRQEAEELKSLKGKGLFVKACETFEKAREKYMHRRVKSVKIEGDRATLTMLPTTGGTETEQTVTMIKEDGIWKLVE